MQTGELCGFEVYQDTPQDPYYANESGYARNVYAGYTPSGKCNIPGDSGGPVYTVKGDGTVQAKGIHSGTGTDVFNNCYEELFTTIHDARNLWTGDLVFG